MKNKLNEMMSSIPSERGEKTDLQILRTGIISEMDAISLYEQLAEIASDDDIKNTLLDIAKEEKTHVGEFEALLKKLDTEQKSELNAGEKEVEKSSNEEDSNDEDSNDEDTEEDVMKEAKERLYGRTAVEGLNEMRRVFNKLIN